MGLEKILIVDDHEVILETLAETVKRFGYKYETASNGREAYEKLKKEPLYDVVITDIKMPIMDGIELLKIINKEYPNTDVVVMTGYHTDYDFDGLASMGAISFILKPFNMSLIKVELERIKTKRLLEDDKIRLEKQTITDSLTGLYNKRRFDFDLKDETDRYKRYKSPLSLLILDIDDFKEYNDSHGHLKGDKLLSELGDVISGTIRGVDKAYRYGGEEFTILLPSTSVENGVTVAERLRSKIAQETTVTISVGICECNDSLTPETFFQKADKLLYKAKREGKNRVCAENV